MRSELGSPRLVALGVAAALLLASPFAGAFCRTTTVPVPPNRQDPACWDQGRPLYQASSCLPYRLLAKESSVIPNAVLTEKLARAFAAWTAPNPTCTPGITAIEVAASSEDAVVSYRQGERGNNVVGVVPVWNHNDSSETLALATLTFNADTGEIYDADLEIRPDVKWALGETPAPEETDLLSVLTHEAGHMLGVAHSTDAEATMFPSYTPGTTDRSLADDDQKAACAIYPTRTTRSSGAGPIAATACNLSPSTGGGGGCGDPEITHGCTMGPGPGGSSGGTCIFVAALVALALFKRRA